MIYLELFLGFLKVGCFAFGGAYGAIPLIRDVVLSHGWLDDEALTYMIAVSESTPGPIMVNLATYVGSSQAGFWGAALATLAVVLPSFFIILLVMVLLKSMLKHRYAQAILRGLKPCISGIILATGLYMLLQSCIRRGGGAATGLPPGGGTTVGFPPGGEMALGPWSLDIRALVVMVLAAIAFWGSERWAKKKLSPIGLILLSAGLGVVIFGVG